MVGVLIFISIVLWLVYKFVKFVNTNPYDKKVVHMPKNIWSVVYDNNTSYNPNPHCQVCILTYKGCPQEINHQGNKGHSSAKNYKPESCPYHRREIFNPFS